MKTFKVETTTSHGIAYIEKPSPRVGANELLIEIRASSLNPHDWKYVDFMRKFAGLPVPDILVGHDVSGVVRAVGRKVREYKPGDEVYAMSAWPGAFGQMIAIDRRMVAHKPSGLNHIQAATVPMAGLTALQAWRIAGLRAGSRVLVIGGSGGVGVYAVQIAKAQGAHVTAVCSGRNVELVASLGADKIVDYTQENVTCMLLAEDEKFDIIFDTIGNENVRTCDSILRSDGHFISTKTSPGNILIVLASWLLSPLRPGKRRVSTFLALPRRKDLKTLADYIAAGKVRPVVDRTFAIENLEEAIDYSKSGRARGKIALDVALEMNGAE